MPSEVSSSSAVNVETDAAPAASDNTFSSANNNSTPQNLQDTVVSTPDTSTIHHDGTLQGMDPETGDYIRAPKDASFLKETQTLNVAQVNNQNTGSIINPSGLIFPQDASTRPNENWKSLKRGVCFFYS